jgi:hypothetical protein
MNVRCEDSDTCIFGEYIIDTQRRDNYDFKTIRQHYAEIDYPLDSISDDKLFLFENNKEIFCHILKNSEFHSSIRQLDDDDEYLDIRPRCYTPTEIFTQVFNEGRTKIHLFSITGSGGANHYEIEVRKDIYKFNMKVTFYNFIL